MQGGRKGAMPTLEETRRNTHPRFARAKPSRQPMGVSGPGSGDTTGASFPRSRTTRGGWKWQGTARRQGRRR